MFTKILVPVDFSDLSIRPLKLAVKMASAHGKIIILSVVDDTFPNPDILSFQLPWADYHRELREEAQRRLSQMLAENGGDGRAEVCIVHGHPARTIVHFACEEKCDLVIMATHGAKGLQHALLGSVTDKVIRQVHCPVLVVRLLDDQAY